MNYLHKLTELMTWWVRVERIRTLAELPFRIDFLFVRKILIILKILGEHKSDNS